MTRKIARYGWRPDLPGNDPRYSAKPVLDDQVDWWQKLPAVPACYDQAALGSCVGNGSGRSVHLLQIKAGKPAVMPSRLQIYYDARAKEGTTLEDSGCQIRDAVLSLVTQGVCPESLWPYDVSKFDVKPPAAAYQAALEQEVIEYRRVDNTREEDLLSAVADGPVIFGMTVYESFESSAVERTGVVPMPKAREKVVGGHCMLITGYDRRRRLFLVDNSWGAAWGQNGRCQIPFDYLTSGELADDFWLLTKMSDGPRRRL